MKNLLVSFKEIYNESDALDKIYESISLVEKLSNIDERFISFKSIIEESYYNLEAIASDKLLNTNFYDFDENRFNEINDRLGVYSDLRRKYKKSTKELIEYTLKIKNDIDQINNYDFIKEQLEKEVNSLYNKTIEYAYIIRKERILVSNLLKESIESHLMDLQLNNAKFDICFNDVDNNNVSFFKDGIDQVDFLVSFNKGEPLKPLSKTASGGELSRFMLALKTILGDKLPMQTKIFDEIDSGVSGGIAHSIGKKLLKISETSQVICITHLPQVASLCDNHLKISKHVIDNRTITKIEKLELNNRIYEIASMISNGNPSDASIKYAEEMINNR